MLVSLSERNLTSSSEDAVFPLGYILITSAEANVPLLLPDTGRYFHDEELKWLPTGSVRVRREECFHHFVQAGPSVWADEL